MKKFLNILIQIKAMAAMVFTGLILAYIAAGWLYSSFKKESFEYSIPLIFILQGLLIAIVISVLWYVLLSDSLIQKMRFYMRIIIFVVSLVAVLSVCFLTFFAFHTNWAKLWLIISGIFIIFVSGIAILGELYFKTTGKRYTYNLEEYKKKNR
ncbi:hypothetical protein [Candidatus Clostridium stratigraminis]|uniref:Uncharacterized protein n=1 Tax=Candidatus Clostridium stratigraminis TaxID=3381661 RepID=A0ABW8T1U4_9CLOT